jgi:hypothetical protein
MAASGFGRDGGLLMGRKGPRFVTGQYGESIRVPRQRQLSRCLKNRGESANLACQAFPVVE